MKKFIIEGKKGMWNIPLSDNAGIEELCNALNLILTADKAKIKYRGMKVKNFRFDNDVHNDNVALGIERCNSFNEKKVTVTFDESFDVSYIHLLLKSDMENKIKIRSESNDDVFIYLCDEAIKQAKRLLALLEKTLMEN